MIKKPSNPITTGDWKDPGFFYELKEGDRLFYIVGQTDGRIPISMIGFGQSGEDVMEKFREGIRYALGGNRSSYTEGRRKMMEKILDATTELHLMAVEIKPNQFFKVGWAVNDTLI